MRKRIRGMTIPELLVSVTVGALLVGVVMSMWYFAYRNWSREQVRSETRMDLEKALERIKSEVRLSSATYTSLYKPTGDTLYRAISFPMATADANGFFSVDASGYIIWDKSVIYHVYENPPGSGNKELRKTEFTDNNSVLVSKTQRDAQLASVYVNGDGSAAPNGSHAATRTIIKNVSNIDFSIMPKEFGVDLYSATTKKSDNIGFGSIRLTSGQHELTFSVTGKNTDSLGYAFGIDTIAITPSGCQREAEVFTPSSSSGDGYSKVYATGWSGDNYAEYNSDGIDDYVTLTLYYDLWRESNFENSVRDNMIITGNDLVLKLATPQEGGEICWQASNQTGSDSTASETFDGMTVRNILMKEFITETGGSVSVKFQASSSMAVTITNAYIVERLGDDDGTGTAVQLLFSGASTVTIPAGSEAWSDFEPFNIQSGRDYFVTFAVNSVCSTLASWQDISGKTGSYGLLGRDSAGTNTWIGSTALSAIYAVANVQTENGASWSAMNQTGDGSTPPLGQSFGMTIRNIVSGSSIEQNGNLVRFKFISGSNQLLITAAYIQERSQDDEAVGPSTQLSVPLLYGATTVYVNSITDFTVSGVAYIDDPNDLPSNHIFPFKYLGSTMSPSPAFTGTSGIIQAFAAGSPVIGNGVYTQLYFSDAPIAIGENEPETGGQKIGSDGGSASAGVNIPAADAGAPDGYYAWTNWAPFVIDKTKSYLVTASVYDSSSSTLGITYWPGASGTTNSYLEAGRTFENSSIWNGSTASSRIYAMEMAENWTGEGAITSVIYDTKVSDPVYNQITWDGTTGSAISVKTRSSDNADMAGAPSWDDISGLNSPSAISIGSGRYVQFNAAFTKSSDYGDYANYPWMDNVTIDWPGETKMCDISGYFAQKPNYGMIKLSVDGQDLTKGLEFNVTVEEKFKTQTERSSLVTEVEARNTGR